VSPWLRLRLNLLGPVVFVPAAAPPVGLVDAMMAAGGAHAGGARAVLPPLAGPPPAISHSTRAMQQPIITPTNPETRRPTAARARSVRAGTPVPPPANHHRPASCHFTQHPRGCSSLSSHPPTRSCPGRLDLSRRRPGASVRPRAAPLQSPQSLRDPCFNPVLFPRPNHDVRLNAGHASSDTS
jgi:hypothetical protein